MTSLPGPAADAADMLVDLVLDSIDNEPEELRARLLASIKAGRHRVYREPHRIVFHFPAEKLAYEIAIGQRRRSDA